MVKFGNVINSVSNHGALKNISLKYAGKTNRKYREGEREKEHYG